MKIVESVEFCLYKETWGFKRSNGGSHENLEWAFRIAVMTGPLVQSSLWKTKQTVWKNVQIVSVEKWAKQCKFFFTGLGNKFNQEI